MNLLGDLRVVVGQQQQCALEQPRDSVNLSSRQRKAHKDLAHDGSDEERKRACSLFCEEDVSDRVEGSEPIHQYNEPGSVELFLGETVLEHKLLDAKNSPFDNNHVGVAVDRVFSDKSSGRSETCDSKVRSDELAEEKTDASDGRAWSCSTGRRFLAKSFPVSQTNSTSVRMSFTNTCIECDKSCSSRGVKTNGLVEEWTRIHDNARKRRQCTQNTYRKT